MDNTGDWLGREDTGNAPELPSEVPSVDVRGLIARQESTGMAEDPSGFPLDVSGWASDIGVHNASTSSGSVRMIRTAIIGEYLYAILGLILGLACIVGGVILGLNGVTGSTSWTASLLGLESQLNDAAPGVVLFVVGLFMIWVTKPKVRMENIRDAQ